MALALWAVALWQGADSRAALLHLYTLLNLSAAEASTSTTALRTTTTSSVATIKWVKTLRHATSRHATSRHATSRHATNRDATSEHGARLLLNQATGPSSGLVGWSSST